MTRGGYKFNRENVEKYVAKPQDRIMWCDVLGLRLTLEKSEDVSPGTDEDFFNIPQLLIRVERFGVDNLVLKLSHLSSEEIDGVARFFSDALLIIREYTTIIDEASSELLESGSELVPDRVFRQAPGGGQNRALIGRLKGIRPSTEQHEGEISNGHIHDSDSGSRFWLTNG